MTSLKKDSKGLPSVGAASRVRVLLVAAASVVALPAVASVWAFAGRASQRAPEVRIARSTSIVSLCPGEQSGVRLSAEGLAPTCKASYVWTASGGRIVGEGSKVFWDLAGVQLGSYDVTLTVLGGDSCGARRVASERVVVWNCPPRVDVSGRPAVESSRAPAAACPNISLCCRAAMKPEAPEPFSVVLTGGTMGVTPKFKWTVSGGEVASGQGTASILVDAKASAGRTMLTTLEVGGYGARCSATCTTEVALAQPTPARTLTLNVSVVNSRDGRVIPGARVSLQHGGDLLADREPTDAAGLFTRGSLHPGTYVVVVNSERFREKRTVVNLDYASSAPVVFSLDPLDIAAITTPTPTPTPSTEPSPPDEPAAVVTPTAVPTPDTGGKRKRSSLELVADAARDWLPVILVIAGLGTAAYLILKAAGVIAGGGATPASEASLAAGVKKQADKVYCTVYAPKSAPPSATFITQVFAHLEGQEGELDERARKCVGGAAERFVSSKRMGREIEREAEIFFILEMEGLKVADPFQTIFWEGKIDSVTFRVTVPDDFEPREVPSNVIYGIVNEAGERAPLGHVNFTFAVAAAAVEPAPQPAAAQVAVAVAAPPQAVEVACERPEQTCVQHTFAFISYAHEDREEVLKRVQAFQAAGTECFMDKLTFKTGEEWEAAIARCIDKSDVFYLFWSRRARESKWIQKEIDLALAELQENKVRPLIRPMPLEDTSVVAPPEKLSHLHFDDPILDNIDAQRHRASLRQQSQQN